MKINNFWGEVTGTSSLKEVLVTGWLGRAYEEGYTHGDDDEDSLVSPAIVAMSKAAGPSNTRQRSGKDVPPDNPFLLSDPTKRLRKCI